MSDFKFSCPACGQHISCDTSNAGMTLACPACHNTLTVPQPPPAAPAAPPALSIAGSQARHKASEAAHAAQITSHTHAQPVLPPSGNRRFSGLAIASFVCSLLPCGGFIAGIICGHLGRRALKRDVSLKGAGFATAGLIISYFSLAFTVVYLAYAMTKIAGAVKQGVAAAQQQSTSNASSSSSNAANRTRSKAAQDDNLWNLNLTTARFPDQPAAGKIHGQDFTVESAQAQNGNITLREGPDLVPDRAVVILTSLKNNQSLAGRKYDISPANSDLSPSAMPHIHLMWKEEGSDTNKIYAKGKDYAMKLELGAMDAGGKIPAKIYLCLPDKEKSYVAGAFDIEAKNGVPPAKPKKPKKQPAN